MNNKLLLKIIAIIVTLTLILSGCSADENILLSNEEYTTTNGIITEVNSTNIATTEDVIIDEESNEGITTTEEISKIDDDDLDITGYASIDVDGGDLSGYREANVVVNIGFGDRKYYAFTNEYGQLFRVVADEIILQDDDSEPVNSKGRYYPDEAKVPGVESKTLDEGHVIADSLGGVSNAYNITPQNSTLNRHGEQAYMEDTIRKAIKEGLAVTDFEAIITYSDIETQIPSHYSFTYTINGNIIIDEFDNINPDEVNADIEGEPPTEVATEGKVRSIDQMAEQLVFISKLDKQAEYIILENSTDLDIDISGWSILSVRGEQSFTFSDYILKPNSTVKIGDLAKNPDVDFHWLDGRGTWNNSDSDPAELYNAQGELVDRYDD